MPQRRREPTRHRITTTTASRHDGAGRRDFHDDLAARRRGGDGRACRLRWRWQVLEQVGHFLIRHKAIRRAIDKAKLAYDFRAGSYTMSALSASMEVERVYLHETTAPQAAAEGAAGDMAGPAPEAAVGLPEAADGPAGRLWRQDTGPST